MNLNNENNKVKIKANLATSYLAFRKSLSKVSDQLKKNATIKVGAYSYKYTELDTILSIINPLLLENDLFIHQEYERIDEVEYMKTILCHVSGEERVFKLPFVYLDTKSMNNIQAFGASITYMRRYALSSIFALATEEDNDCNDSAEIIRHENTLSNKESKKQDTKSKYSYYEYLLRFALKVHKQDNIKVKPFFSLDQIESFIRDLKDKNNDINISRYFTLNPHFKDVVTWRVIIEDYIRALKENVEERLERLSKFFKDKENCVDGKVIQMFSCMQKEKDFDYLFN